jgi:hypothetical protein
MTQQFGTKTRVPPIAAPKSQATILLVFARKGVPNRQHFTGNAQQSTHASGCHLAVKLEDLPWILPLAAHYD